MVTKQVFVQLTLAGLLSVTAAALARGQQSIDELPSDLRKAVFEATYAVRHAGGEAVYPVFIDPWIATEEAKLTAPDGMEQDHFGISIAVSGDTAVIGATGDSHPGAVSAGSAYVFVRSGTTWSEQQKLVASDAATNDRFGVSVAISGDTVVVGADLADIADGGQRRLGLRLRAQRDDLERAGQARSRATRRSHDTSAIPSPCRATRPWSGPLATTPRLATCRLGLRLRAQRDDLERAGEAHRRATRRPTTASAIRSPYQGDTAVVGACSGRPRGRRGCRLGLRLRAQRDHLEPAGEAHRQRRGGP